MSSAHCRLSEPGERLWFQTVFPETLRECILRVSSHSINSQVRLAHVRKFRVSFRVKKKSKGVFYAPLILASSG